MNIIQALEAFGLSTGEYWSQDNAAFEHGNPSFLARAARSVNPMSGFGAALGAMHDAAGAGFPAKDTAIALVKLAALRITEAIPSPFFLEARKIRPLLEKMNIGVFQVFEHLLQGL